MYRAIVYKNVFPPGLRGALNRKIGFVGFDLSEQGENPQPCNNKGDHHVLYCRNVYLFDFQDFYKVLQINWYADSGHSNYLGDDLSGNQSQDSRDQDEPVIGPA